MHRKQVGGTQPHLALRASTEVEPRLRHKNQKIMAASPDLELPLARERHLSASAT
jgi:hypothetical protein